MWQLSKANRLKCLSIIIVTRISLGGGSKPFLQCVLHTFSWEVCVCVFHEANNFVKIYHGVLCFVYMYSMCICAISDFVFKSDYLWFHVCKVAPRMWIYFCCVPKCDHNRVLCANSTLEENLYLAYSGTFILCVFFCSSKGSDWWIINCQGVYSPCGNEGRQFIESVVQSLF